MAAFDPVELEINEAFNQMIFSINQRRETVLTAYRNLKLVKRQRTLSLSLVTKQGTRGSQIGHFNYPLNLVVSANGNVYVADCRNNRVQILNSSLQHLRTLTEQLIKVPCDIKLTAYVVYVLCKYNPCVHVFSHAGDKLRFLLSSGYLMQVAHPDYFCLDAVENIIMSDYSAHRVQIFSKEGNLIKTMGEEGQQPGMLRHPTGLALTKKLKLVVVSHNNNFTFQIFSSQ